LQARYCDEENAFVQCAILQPGKKKLALKSEIVGHVYLGGVELTTDAYTITFKSNPVGKLPPGVRLMTGLIYTMDLKLKQAPKTATMLMVIYPGALHYYAHHPEDDVKP
jgi:hypothetical protein